jgi:two-component system response regulator RegX3
MEKILILSENETASGFLGVVLQREHFLPILASSRVAALQNICTLQPDILMIDLPIADTSSVELCMELARCHVNKDIIVLGDSNDEIDKVLALEAGADDYIVKPFATRELVARVRALLRRRKANPRPVIRFGNVEVDRQRRTVTCSGKEVNMSPCEYKLLLFFLTNVDLALTRQTLLQSVWGYSEDASSRTLDAHVSRLRNKCEPDPTNPRHIVTIHGIGYRFLM